jgi:hypothetical protein
MKPFVNSLVATAWACMLVSGCSRSPGLTGTPALGGPNGLVTWSPSAGKDNPLPGVDQGTVYNLGTAFVVWSDAAGGGGGSSSGNVQGFKCQGYLLAQDWRGKQRGDELDIPSKTLLLESTGESQGNGKQVPCPYPTSATSRGFLVGNARKCRATS